MVVIFGVCGWGCFVVFGLFCVRSILILIVCSGCGELEDDFGVMFSMMVSVRVVMVSSVIVRLSVVVLGIDIRLSVVVMKFSICLNYLFMCVFFCCESSIVVRGVCLFDWF